jgi:HAE1 family hydrophobic/amphiphilic exporter-1
VNRLTQFAVSRRSVTLLATAALFVAGIVAWGGLKQELLPDVSFPIVTVVTPYPGAGASDVAEQVTEPIEQALSTVSGLSQLRTTSANSLGFAVAQFEYGTDLDEAVATIESNVRRLTLPDGVEPTVSAFNFNEAPVVVASLSTTDSTDLEALTRIATDEIVPELQGIAGVVSVDLAGGLEDQLVITLDPTSMADAGVSVQQVMAVLQANNLTLPGGEMPVDGVDIPVSTIGRFDSASEIEALVVGVRTTPAPEIPGAPTPPVTGLPIPITLSELGTVEEVSLPTTGLARTNGEPSITISVGKTSAANTVEVAEAVQAALDEAAERHEGEATIVTVADQSAFIIESTEGLLREGGLGAVFAVLTIFLFLFSVRSTFVAAISIPLSILTALDPDRPRDHAGRRDHPEHPHSRRPRGGHRSGGGRLDRRPREHLPPPGAR